MGIPICLVKNKEYIKVFFDLNIEGYIGHINYKNNKECLLCNKYSNCFGSINSNLKPNSFKEYNKNYISGTELLTKITFINTYFLSMGIKLGFYSHVYDLSYIIKNNISSEIKLINCIIIEGKDFFRRGDINLDSYDNIINSQGFEHNLLLNDLDYKNLNYIFNQTGLSLEFSIVKDFNIFLNYTNINSNYIYIKYCDFKLSILEILENIFIVKNIDIKNKLFIGTGIGKYIGELIFINCNDIYSIKNDFDKYIVFVTDGLIEYVPYIYNFKYFITHQYNPVALFL